MGKDFATWSEALSFLSMVVPTSQSPAQHRDTPLIAALGRQATKLVYRVRPCLEVTIHCLGTSLAQAFLLLTGSTYLYLLSHLAVPLLNMSSGNQTQIPVLAKQALFTHPAITPPFLSL